jgi:outer membrane protein assembly factor BamB
VVVFDSFDGTSYVADRSTGDLLWATSADVRLVVGDGSLIFLDMPGQRVGVRDPMTGREIWTASVDGRPAAPLVANGMLLVSAAAASGDDELAAFDLATGTERWRLEAGELGNGLKIPFREVLVVSDLAVPDTTLYGISLDTGKVLWDRTTSQQAGAITGIEIDGRGLLVAPDGGTDVLIDVATGQTLAASSLRGGQTAVAAGAVYQSPSVGEDQIRGLRLADFEQQWAIPRSRQAYVFGAASDTVLIIDEADGVSTLTAWVEGDAGVQ